ncbi:NAD(P)H-quinone oxidoreductase subunit 1, chloroplastic [bioreactor metagenome]|uniref:NAD(P)H-quinone oxidoreductase subunit 1, chloroplastic n=1 Tax=bioreactor metagenome TaxID=1076179 RepID=A0A644TXH1_9ZZZZ|nr:NADH-quinone oxidoreductase subunit H [Methanocorpusculum sp.]
MDIMFLVGAVLFLTLAPILGGLLTGCDRVLTARFQSRVGPPLLQPFYDVAKLWHKEKAFSNPVEIIFTTAYLVLIAFSGAMLATGGNLLFVIFSLALAHTFLILAAYAANAPYSNIGAERELLSLMILEPILILLAAGCFLVTGSFDSYHMLILDIPGIIFLPGVFIAFIAVLTLKLRKSPFDISTSHHAHQELVKGVTSSLSGRSLAKVEIAHWYEMMIFLSIILFFFAGYPVLSAIAIILVFLLEIVIDNIFPRVTWKMTVKSLWLVTLVFGVGNIVILGILGGIV